MSSKTQVQAAVDRIIPQTLSFAEVGGRVDQTKAFEELREITLTLLALNPNAILQIVKIVRDKTAAATVAEFDLVSTLKDSLDNLDTGPVTQPIRSAESLGNAGAALTNLQADIATGFVESVNVDNAKVSIDAFLNSQIAQNVKAGGSAIVTKEEAKRQIRETLPLLVNAHQETLRLLFQLEKVLEEFLATDLRVLVGNTVVERSRDIIEEIREFSTVAPLPSASRSTKHLAELATIKRLLGSYFETPGALDPRLVGTAANSIQVKLVGAGTPAQLLSTTTVRPLVTIETGASVVDITGNGTPTSVDLLTVGIASTPGLIFGTVGESYTITLGVNDSFDLSVDGSTIATITLTAGVRTAAQIASDINGTYAGVASAASFNGLTVVKLESTTNGRNSNILTGAGNANAVLGFADNTIYLGTDPLLEDVASALSAAQVEYSAEAVDDSPALTTLVTSTIGVIVGGSLTDGSVADFLAAGVQGGDEIIITSGQNAGITLPIARVTAADLRLEGVTDDTSVDYTIVRGNQKLQITSTKSDLTSALTVDSGNANTNLGFSGSEADIGTFPLVQIEQQVPAPPVPLEVSLFNIIPGDLLDITGVGVVTVIGLEQLAGEPVVRVTPEITAFTGTKDFTAKGFGAESFIAFIDEPIDPAKPLPFFIANTLPVNGYEADLRVLEDAVAQALNDPAKAAAASAFADDLKSLLDAVSGLQFILAGYDAADLADVSLVFDVLEEHNFDRFLDLLTEGRIEEMLQTTVDNFSFEVQLQSAARKVNTEDLDVRSG